ncbi:hypothetical protein AB1Y20_017819 [Prymnesium parvum]|uniref:Non-reducing end beta-L-arabinofuranosidase-like GH127 catalytic domain-containing protein n=1 Tax=Prymnesium parvum TaxID=97485 RepID=A0AB34JNL1_PRYPA
MAPRPHLCTLRRLPFWLGLALLAAMLMLVQQRRQMLSSSMEAEAPGGQPLAMSSTALQLPASDDEAEEDLTEAAADVAGRRTLQCAVYAGPLRWRRHPGGRGAQHQPLHAAEAPRERRTLRPAPRYLQPFPVASVRLLPGTPFSTAAETNTAFLRLLSLDRLLFSFRATAGLPQPHGAKPYGGWESPGAGIRGHFVGHYLSALATGAANGDESLLSLAHSALRVLEECQRAHTRAGRSGYLSAFPESEFDKVESLCASGCTAWVPHYAVHKVLQGLLSLHHELGNHAALHLACGMGHYIWARAARVHSSNSATFWREFLDYEVGALAQTFVDLAVATRNDSWLEAASLFDRRCFTAPLELAGAMHALADPVPHAGAWWQSDKEQATADAAMRGMHANAQLAYVLSAASAYDATGDSRSRRGVEAFWRQLQSAYTYVAGGSSFQEEWREPRRVAESLRHRGGANWAAHDHQESCVTHNSIALSLRKLAWHRLPTDTERLPHVSSRPARGEASRRGVASALAHADWIERAMHNGVLGTQRGVQPGAMVYMLPQGGGVSKAGGNHGFSRPLDHFWCCVGSGIEAFTRLQHGVFWRHTRLPSGQPPHLVVLQPLISTELLWAEAGCRVTLVADAIGSRLPSLPQRVDIRAAATSPRGNCSLTLSVRVPSWAVRPTARLVHTAQALEASLVAEAGALLSTSLSTTSHLQLELWAQLRLVAASPPATPPSSADDSVLHGLMFGPLLLAALTDGDRRLFQTTEARSITQPPRPIAAPAAWTTEVGEEAREQLATFEWLQQFDRQTKRPTPFSAEPTGRVLSHRGEGSPLSFQQTPPTIPLQPGSRGGSDGANSATWRVTLRPVHNSLGPSTPASLISQPVSPAG